MGFSESIKDFLRFCNMGDCPYRITVLGSGGVYVEGVIKICDVKPDVIILNLKGEKAVFHGKNLSLSSYVEKDISISGKVEKIEWQK